MRGEALRHLTLDVVEIAALRAKQFSDIKAAVAIELRTRNESVVLEIGVILADPLDEGRPNRIQVHSPVSRKFIAGYGTDDPGFVRLAVVVDLIRHYCGLNVFHFLTVGARPRH